MNENVIISNIKGNGEAIIFMERDIPRPGNVHDSKSLFVCFFTPSLFRVHMIMTHFNFTK